MNANEWGQKVKEWGWRVAQLQQRAEKWPRTQQREGLPEADKEVCCALTELEVDRENLIEQQEALVKQVEELKGAGCAAQVERQRYEELLEWLPEGYLLTDANGTIREANRAAAQMLGESAQFLMGKPLSIFIDPEERRNFYCQLNQFDSSCDRLDLQVRLVRRDESRLLAAISVAPKGGFWGWLLRELSSTQPAQQEGERWQLAQSSTLDSAIAQSNLEKQRAAFLSEANRLLASSLDYFSNLEKIARLAVPAFADWCAIDILKNNLTVFREPIAIASAPEKTELLLLLMRRYPPQNNEHLAALTVARSDEPQLVGEISEAALQAMARDAEHLDLLHQIALNSQIVVPLMVRGTRLGTIAFASAQPERRYGEADLAMVRELAQQVAIALDGAMAHSQAQKANQIKDEFLGIVSHELRTPLNSILGWAQMLRKGRINEATAARALETIERSAKQQTKLIDDILDISCILKGQMHLNRYPVHPIAPIAAAIEEVRPLAASKNIYLEARFDASVGLVNGDSQRLQQIVWNLLSNAIKFTPPGGRVEVRLAQANSMAEISVSDTGQGISAEFLPYLFHRFRQADTSTTRFHGGLGLGLAIARNLVEMHDGTVFATSEGEGRGASFTVHLPLIERREPKETQRWNNGKMLAPSPPPAPQPARAPTLPHPLSGLRVLVVDDDDDTRELIAFILEQYQVQVTQAASASEALAAIARQQPDILLSDISMPDEDGYSLIRQVRTLEAQKGGHIPAVALTAFASTKERTQALGAGFQMHVSKPVEASELVSIVANLTGRNS